jgi:hypothetical protein
MMKLLKHIRKYMLIILTVFVLMVTGAFFVFFTLTYLKSKVKETNLANIKIDEDGNWEIPNFETPDLVYADTMEEALSFNVDYYFKRYPYMYKVNDVIKVFENDEYATMFYHTIKDSKREGLVASKFKIKMTNEKKQYALISVELSEMGGAMISTPLKTMRDAAPLYDYMSEFSINKGDRFIYGSFGTEKVKTIKIEGQSPTEVIEYLLKGKKEYFWYYENLISDKPSSQFDIEMEEE